MTVCDLAVLGIPTMAATSIAKAVSIVGIVCLISVHSCSHPTSLGMLHVLIALVRRRRHGCGITLGTSGLVPVRAKG